MCLYQLLKIALYNLLIVLLSTFLSLHLHAQDAMKQQDAAAIYLNPEANYLDAVHHVVGEYYRVTLQIPSKSEFVQMAMALDSSLKEDDPIFQSLYDIRSCGDSSIPATSYQIWLQEQVTVLDSTISIRYKADQALIEFPCDYSFQQQVYLYHSGNSIKSQEALNMEMDQIAANALATDQIGERAYVLGQLVNGQWQIIFYTGLKHSVNHPKLTPFKLAIIKHLEATKSLDFDQFVYPFRY